MPIHKPIAIIIITVKAIVAPVCGIGSGLIVLSGFGSGLGSGFGSGIASKVTLTFGVISEVINFLFPLSSKTLSVVISTFSFVSKISPLISSLIVSFKVSLYETVALSPYPNLSICQFIKLFCKSISSDIVPKLGEATYSNVKLSTISCGK